MTGKRNLRSRVVVLENSSNDSEEKIKKGTSIFKGKLHHEKENELTTSNVIQELDFKDQKKCKSHQSTLTNIKNWPLTNILKESNSNVNISKKVLAMPKEREPLRENCKRKIVKRNCVLQSGLAQPLSKKPVSYTEGVKKRPAIPINKQKQIKKVSEFDQNDSKLKEHKKPTIKIQSKKKLVDPTSGNCINEKNLNVEERTDETEISIKKPATKIPIWRKCLDINKSNRSKKRRSNVDIYDMSQDEELMSDKVVVVKKSHNKKRNLNNKDKKHCPISSSKVISSKTNKSSKLENMNVPLETNWKRAKVANTQLTVAETKLIASILPSDQNVNNDAVCDFVDENDSPNIFAVPFESDPIEITETNLNFLASEPKCQSNNYVANLADELERSFLIPKMASTPGTMHLKTVIRTKKKNVAKVSNISNITTINGNCLNTTVDTPESVCNIAQKETVENIGDITLFDSPVKDEKKGKKLTSPKKTIQINLFGELLNSPSSVDTLEESVLTSRKAYHTPDNFKANLIRTKRIAENIRKEPKKSKQDMLIEKLALHFDEIGDTELCVE